MEYVAEETDEELGRFSICRRVESSSLITLDKGELALRDQMGHIFLVDFAAEASLRITTLTICSKLQL